VLLRDRQKTFVCKCKKALKDKGNTLGIAPTGAGKTVMLSAVAADLPQPTIILQHRTELVTQNQATFKKMNKGVPTSLYTADYKRFAKEGATFAMVQTLVRNLEDMPPIGSIIVDEAHHSSADSYLKIFDTARRANPKLKLFGVTATPQRGDKRGLRGVYDNVADQITLQELIVAGFLVKPRTFVVDLGMQGELGGIKRPGEFNMEQVEAIMNKRAVNDAVLDKWREMAGDRRTVAFCSTVAHAHDVADTFRAGGVTCAVVEGEMSDGDRKQILDDFDAGKIQVVFNCMVLTEGWDCQPVSCVILLRPTSFKSTMIQMIGRGLRKVDPERYPGIHKSDCIVLDFGYSLLTHGDLSQAINIDAEKPPKECPECAAEMPASLDFCAVCGYEWPRLKEVREVGEGPGGEEEYEALTDFVMTEVDLLKASPFQWEDMFNGLVTVANGIDAWAVIVNFKGEWCGIGGSKETGIRLLAREADRIMALAAADDYLREHGDDDAAKKSKRWLKLPPSDKQLQHLGLSAMSAMGISRYRASCMMTWRWNERGIQHKLMAA